MCVSVQRKGGRQGEGWLRGEEGTQRRVRQRDEPSLHTANIQVTGGVGERAGIYGLSLTPEGQGGLCTYLFYRVNE